MRKNIGNLLWGLLFIGVGVGLIGDLVDLWNYKVFFEGWWTVFIIVPAVISMVQGGIRVSNLIILSIGVLLLLDRQDVISEGLIFEFAGSAILIIIGIAIISKMFNKKSSSVVFSSNKSRNEDNPDYIAVFSGNTVKNSSTNFQGGSATAVFGGNDIDLSDVVLAEDVTFTVTSIFGGNDIIAPKNAKIEMNGVPIFGGNDNSAKSSTDPDAYTITFTCTSIFGGTDIK